MNGDGNRLLMTNLCKVKVRRKETCNGNVVVQENYVKAPDKTYEV